MNKKITIILIIVVVILGALFLFKNNSVAPTVQNVEETPSTDNTAPVTSPTATIIIDATTKSTVVVTYTDSGFSPQNITIKKGDTVTFVNKSSIGMWVASGPHPTHTNYPAFDEKATVSNGGSWSFTFDLVGSWGYHNHKNSAAFGKVIIE
ncbi:MAG: hypothetical protein A3E02_01420 [Candidatus Zambryskibacteria bacterium RIFCSPHIGHO2_12_FULL_38_34]|uniref:Blue (type 1) copper domain-containing protein n=1 Tax=Candidatus Zambryskibacteria bacterium RIFCSPLOWO2_12_FULL_39_16 TaxID=1802775 RepID=A0A1G2UTH7_9BACT|nr:MAG: hypothetical protein A3E02_01420 [Candidatus Zambryskibacteria bacterium RIFCSPHIGHO2_12_FULL_38_34]OHB08281.1 MAG: hypothetical protein A3I19_01515 [Candidatus Zambryskibacteria bacterium RIFCSPLOWO2_02_FULL_38_13]OHB12675.1 MAG: hypothetical protein A3G46_00570 [Candidatus Zambryskibacteria bacterium RIFCSPLOWO2_12_FULL_39_16]